jgi:hypothetical protein
MCPTCEANGISNRNSYGNSFTLLKKKEKEYEANVSTLLFIINANVSLFNILYALL